MIIIHAWSFIIIFTLTCSSFAEEGQTFLNEWAVEVKGGERIAKEVSTDHGLHFLRQIGSLEDKYHLSQGTEVVRSKRETADVTARLATDARVTWVRQQPETRLSRRSEVPVKPDATGDDYDIDFNDPLWPKQWYLHNDGQQGAVPGVDMNLVPAWKLGFTGKGVVVTVVDDGVDYTHTDLAPNYDAEASFDFNNKSQIDDIDPRPDDSKEAGYANAHGTRCAGEIAAVANNGVCGVGAAYEVGIGGLKILGGPVTDAMEASAILYHNNHIDIYSCCWGPPDDGKTFQKPGALLEAALAMGAKDGREGKGSIFVWASGNGGHVDDDCSADAYVGNIHTISIGSANDEGESVNFMEKCPSTMAVTLSGGVHNMRGSNNGGFPINEVMTTDLHNGCTTKFIGTSSAAPLASGILALVLQANPSLTWRDVQHIVVHGSNIPNPVEGGWHINGAGYHLNHRFGFGVLDAGKMVSLALTWENVPKQQVCKLPAENLNLVVLQGETKSISVTVDSCHKIRQLEHTQVYVSLLSPRRGDISIKLYSPSGTPSELLSTRAYDSSSDGLHNWPFMTVHNWGEDPQGVWTLKFTYNETPEGLNEEPPPIMSHKRHKRAMLISMSLTLYGIGLLEENDDSGENPAINPDQAGHNGQDTVIGIYNDEQLDNEEIVLDIDDLAEDANVPPNAEHNLDDDDGDVIDTGNFDGVLLGASQNLILNENLLDGLDEDFREILRELVLEEETRKMLDTLDDYSRRGKN